MSPSEQQLMLASGRLISISQAAKGTPYSTEYLSLLARKGRLKAVKISRDWLTTEDSVREYLQVQQQKHSKMLEELSQSMQQQEGFAGIKVLFMLGIAIVGVSGFLAYQLTGMRAITQVVNVANGIVSLAERGEQILSQKFSHKGMVVSQSKLALGAHETAQSQTEGEVLGQTVKNVASQPVVSESMQIAIEKIINQKLDDYTSFLAAFGIGQGASTGYQNLGGQSGPVTGITQNANGNSSAVVGGTSIVTYIQAAPQNNFSGGSIAGFTQLSTQGFTAETAQINQNLNVSGSTVLAGGISVGGNANIGGNTAISGSLSAGTSTLSSLTVSGPVTLSGSTTIAGLTVTSFNPNLTQGSVPFQGASGLAQDNSNFFYDSTNHRLGIGTSTPSARLSVTGSPAVDPFDISSTSGASLLHVTQAGNLGIGVTNPTGTLSIANDGSAAYFTSSTYRNSAFAGGLVLAHARGSAASPTFLNNNDRIGSIFFKSYDSNGGTDPTNQSSNAAAIDVFSEGGSSSTSTPGRIVFSTTPVGSVFQSERMRIDSNGNIGIGTTSPQGKLHIFNSSDNQLVLDASGQYTSVYMNNNGVLKAGWYFDNVNNKSVIGSFGNATTTSQFTYGTGTTGMVLNSNGLAINNGSVGAAAGVGLSVTSGNVGVGTTTPGSALDVNGNINTNGVYKIGANPMMSFTSSASGLLFSSYSLFGGSASNEAIAIGPGSSANDNGNGSGAIAIGGSSIANGAHSTVIGYGATAGSFTYATALGQGASAAGAFATALGQGASANFSNSTAIGYNVVATSANQVVLGNTSVTQTLLNGNVGIGTTSPANKLHVYSSGATYMQIDAPAAQQDGVVISKDNVGKWLTYVPSNSNDLRFFDYTADRVTFKNGGNVGIGTSSPIALLDISAGTTRGLHIANSNATPFGLMINNTTFGSTDSTGFGIFQENTGITDFYNNNIAAIKIGTGGTLGVGTAPAAAEKLFIIQSNTTGANYGLDVQATGSGATTNTAGYFAASGATNNYGLVVASGNVGIGTTNPGFLLDVNNTTTGNYVVKVKNNGAGASDSALLIDTAQGGASVHSLTVKNSGNTVLDVNGSATAGVSVSGTNISMASTYGIAFDTGHKYVPWDGSKSYIQFSGTDTFQFINGANSNSVDMILKGGNVGIGTTSPSQKLDIWGNLNVATGTIPTLFVDTANGRVGINQVPTSALSVNGTITSSAIVNTAGGIQERGSSILVTQASPVDSLVIDNITSGSARIITNSTVNLALGTNNSLSQLVLQNGGNIGIGTTNPTSVLQVQATNNNGTTFPLNITNNVGTSIFKVRDDGVVTTANSINSGQNVSVASGSYLKFGSNLNMSSPSNGILLLQNISATDFNSLQFGGTTSAFPAIHSINTSTGAQNALQVIGADGSANVNLLITGNVGIGTTTPLAKLDVEGANTTDVNLFQDTNGLRVMTTDSAAAGKGGIINLGGSYLGTTQVGFASIRGGLEAAGSSNGYLGLYTTKSGTGSVEAMRITSQGNVGIGTTTPDKLLTVYGNMDIGSYVAGQNLTINGANAGGNPGSLVSLKDTTSNVTWNLENGRQNGSFDIYGASGGPGQALTINSSGNVSIATTTSSARLVIQGSGSTSASAALTMYNSAGTLLNTFLNNGNVGIGTATPTTALEVNANSAGGNTIRIDRLNTGGNATVLFGNTSDAASYTVGMNSDGTNNFYIRDNDASKNVFTIGDAAPANSLYIQTTTGNIGIGTTTPDAPLTINSGALLNSAPGVNYYRNVGSYVPGTSPTGTMKITFPKALGNGSYVNITIRGFNYTAGANYGEWQVKVAGYDFSTGWHAYGSEINGNPPFSTVRLGDDGTSKVILLGATTTPWTTPSVSITDVMVSNTTSVLTGWGSGWGIAIISSESSLNNIINTVPGRNGQINFSTIPSAVPVSTDGTYNSFYQTSGSQYARLGVVDGGGGIPTRFTYLQGGFTGSALYYNTALNPLGGNVGIGATSTPGSSLSVFGGMAVGGNYASSTAPANGLIIQGNVGIGTTTPNALLNVVGSGFAAIVAGQRTDGAVTSALITLDSSSGSSSFQNSSGDLKVYTAGVVGSNVGSERMRVTLAGNIGLGTTTPSARLSVTGTPTVDPFDISSTSGTSLMHVTQAGNVGIGTISPGALFEVNNAGTTVLSAAGGTSAGTNGVYARYISSDNFLAFYDTAAHAKAPGVTGRNWYADNTGNTKVNGSFSFAPTGGDVYSTTDTYLSRSAANTLRVSSDGTTGLANLIVNGNVGIGTTTPGAKLDIAGGVVRIGAGGYVSATAGDLSVTRESATATGAIFFGSTGTKYLYYDGTNFNFNGGGFVSNGSISTTGSLAGININRRDNSASAFTLYSAAGDLQYFSSGTGGDVMRLTSAGNIGLGTTTPSARLSVTGTPTVDPFDVSSTSGASIMHITQAGNVGIGTTNPSLSGAADNTELDISAGTAATKRVSLGLQGSRVSTGDISDVRFYNASNQIANIAAGWDGANDAGALILRTQPTGGSLTERMRIDSNGNVGVGTSTPGSKLTVAGDINFTGNLLQNGSSFATSQWTTSGSNIYYSTGNATVGGTGPASISGATRYLSVASPSGNGNLSALELQGYSSTNNAAIGQVSFVNSNGNSEVSRIESFILGNTGTGGIRFLTGSSGSLGERLRIDTTGNVGIGTTTPGQLLDIQKDQNALTALRVMNGTSGTSARSAIVVGASSDSFQLTIDAFSNGYSSSGSDDAQNGGRLLVSGAGGFAFRVSNAAASLRYYTGSSERMRIDNTGNVGIGTTGPTSNLHVVGTTNVATLEAQNAAGSKFLNFTYSGSPGSSYGSFQIQPSSLVLKAGAVSNGRIELQPYNSGTYTAGLGLVVDSTGNVGIGTTTPGSLLEISGSSSTGIVETIKNISTVGTTAYSGLVFSNYNGSSVTTSGAFLSTANSWNYGTYNANQLNMSGIGTGGLGLRTTGSASISFYTAGSDVDHAIERMRIDSNGNVGIGTTTPQASLDLEGSLTVNNGAITYSTTTMLTVIDNLQTGASSFETDAGIVTWEDMPVTASSSAGTVESYRAQINGTPILTVYSEADGSGGIQNTRVGIGTTTPTKLLSVGDGTGSGVIARFQNSTGYCDINPTTTSLTCTSDRSLKKNINPMSDSLAKVMQLQSVWFNWTNETATSTPHPGFIAQDVEKIMPEIVATDPDTGIKSIAYSNAIPYLVGALQEQQNEILMLQGASTASSTIPNVPITIKRQINFSGDTVGEAQILTGATSVTVKFKDQYTAQPIVVATPMDFVTGAYRVTSVDASGFTIEMQTPQNGPVTFNWHAFGGDGAKLTVSDGTSSDVVLILPPPPPDSSSGSSGDLDAGQTSDNTIPIGTHVSPEITNNSPDPSTTTPETSMNN